MPKIRTVIDRLLPNGSNQGKAKSIRRCPAWPPDLFAVAATLLEKSSFYAQSPVTAGWDGSNYVCSQSYVAEVKKLGQEWAETTFPPRALEKLWSSLLRYGESEIVSDREAEWEPFAGRIGVTDPVRFYHEHLSWPQSY